MGKVVISFILSIVATTQFAHIEAGSSSVDIINDIKSPIIIHCRSQEDDLEIQLLPPEADYNFEFNPNIFGTTLFTCSFAWGMRTQEFVVWEGDEYLDQLDCAKMGSCVWKVTTRGFYWSIPSANDLSWTLYEQWNL